MWRYKMQLKRHRPSLFPSSWQLCPLLEFSAAIGQLYSGRWIGVALQFHTGKSLITPGAEDISWCKHTARRLYKRETALLSTKFFHEGSAAKPRRNVRIHLVAGYRSAYSLLLSLSFSPLPPAFVFFKFYSQFARRSLNWSAFRRQSKSNQTLTSITNAPWIPVKPRIPTISVFRRTADNSGFTALLKISTVPTVADLRSDTSGLNMTSRFFLPLFLVHEIGVSHIGLHALYQFISINDPTTFSFYLGCLIGSELLSHINQEKTRLARFYYRQLGDSKQQSINFLLTNFGRYAHEMKFYVFNAMRLKRLFSASP